MAASRGMPVVHLPSGYCGRFDGRHLADAFDRSQRSLEALPADPSPPRRCSRPSLMQMADLSVLARLRERHPFV